MENIEQLSLAKIGTRSGGKSAYDGELSQTITKIVNKEIDTHERNQPISKTFFEPSSITQCPRRIVYRYNSMKTGGIGSSYLSRVSRATNMQKWLDFLDKCGKITVLDSNVLVADSHCNLTGHLDGVVEVELISGYKQLAAIKIRELASNAFQKLFTKEGDKYALKNDIIDLNVCMWMAGLTKGILLYADPFLGLFNVSEIDLNNQIVDKVGNKCKNLNYCCVNGKLPDRPYEEISSECNVCEFKTKCWN